MVILKLLKKYLNELYNGDVTKINHWNVDGADCYVDFDVNGFSERKIINIWEMMVYLNGEK